MYICKETRVLVHLPLVMYSLIIMEEIVVCVI